jgi:hypothetical protein
MSQSFDAIIHDVVIATGTNATRAIFGTYEYSDATAIIIQAPATLDALIFTIEVSSDASTWATLTDGTSALPTPVAGTAMQYTDMLGSKYFRLKASGNVSADRIFRVSKQWVS